MHSAKNSRILAILNSMLFSFTILFFQQGMFLSFVALYYTYVYEHIIYIQNPTLGILHEMFTSSIAVIMRPLYKKMAF